APGAVLGAGGIPFPIGMRASALLALNRSWSGPLAIDSTSLAAGLAASGSLAEAAGIPPPAPEQDFEAREAVLEIGDVRYAPRGPGRQNPLIADVNLRVGKGEVVALVGVSGSGKSTLLKLAASLLDPTSGSIHHPASGNGRDRPTALALEYPERQLFGRTVEEDVTATLWVDGVPVEERRARGREAMELVGLRHETFASRVPMTLSEGEKRRVALASLLAQPPRVLLLDEPTAGLDPEGRRALAGVMRGLSARGHAILMASHDLDFASAVADRIVVLGRDLGEPGRILGEGRPPAIWHDRTLLGRAHLPSPDFVLTEQALRGPMLPRLSLVRDSESLLSALARALEGRDAINPASASRAG
ncbi:MAG TPA: ABC transporter ATP-binding protein, partial [Candidatus Eisenbacteria bacterium]